MSSYLACDQCGEWYHFDCVGLTECHEEEANELHYVC